MARILNGTITEISKHTQRVETDSGDHNSVIFMRGINYIQGGKVGDKVVLEYRTGPSYGLFFGEVVEVQHG